MTSRQSFCLRGLRHPLAMILTPRRLHHRLMPHPLRWGRNLLFLRHRRSMSLPLPCQSLLTDGRSTAITIAADPWTGLAPRSVVAAPDRRMFTLKYGVSLALVRSQSSLKPGGRRCSPLPNLPPSPRLPGMRPLTRTALVGARNGRNCRPAARWAPLTWSSAPPQPRSQWPLRCPTFL